MGKIRDFSDGSSPPWMLIFTDMMTLLLTFFIILVSMAAIDEQSRVRAVESVRSVFGVPDMLYNTPQPEGADALRSGAQSSRAEDAMHEARQLLFSDNQHISLRSSDSEIALEVAGDMLFEAGGVVIGEAGRIALDRLVPILMQAQQPVTIAAHSAPSYSEGAGGSLEADRALDGSWALSMGRGLSVYRYFVSRGVSENILRLESFGSHRPAYDSKTAYGRRMNRRVDIILNKHDAGLASLLMERPKDPGNQDYIFRDFHFDLEFTPPPPAEGRR